MTLIFPIICAILFIYFSIIGIRDIFVPYKYKIKPYPFPMSESKIIMTRMEPKKGKRKDSVYQLNNIHGYCNICNKKLNEFESCVHGDIE